MENLSLKISEPLKHQTKMQDVHSRMDDKEKAKIAKAAKEFESLLTSMMLKSMNKTTGGMLGEEGYGNDTFDALFEQKISSYLSESKDLGLARVLYKKITGEDLDPTISFKRTDAIEGLKNIKKSKESGSPVEISPSSGSIERLQKFEDLINDASSRFDIDKNLIKSVIMTESAANHKAVSSAKAKGLMQLMDSTATDMGVKNVFDPKQNINGGAKYLAQMIRQYDGDLKLALAAYNAGPKNVQKYDGVPPFEETKNYISKVLGYLNHFNEKEL